MDIKISFPGGKKVYAEVNGMIIKTDQPKEYGGEGTAPSPFLHFLASIGTCAGMYVLGFCQERGIPTDDISINQRMVYVPVDEKKMRLDKIVLDIVVPPSFPEKYINAIKKVADQCAVKKTIIDPPAFEVKASIKK